MYDLTHKVASLYVWRVYVCFFFLHARLDNYYHAFVIYNDVFMLKNED